MRHIAQQIPPSFRRVVRSKHGPEDCPSRPPGTLPTPPTCPGRNSSGLTPLGTCSRRSGNRKFLKRVSEWKPIEPAHPWYSPTFATYCCRCDGGQHRTCERLFHCDKNIKYRSPKGINKRDIGARPPAPSRAPPLERQLTAPRASPAARAAKREDKVRAAAAKREAATANIATVQALVAAVANEPSVSLAPLMQIAAEEMAKLVAGAPPRPRPR